MEQNQSVHEGSGSAQSSEPSGALLTPPTLNEPQPYKPQPDETHQAPPPPATPDPTQPDLGQPKPADSVKRRSKKRYGPTVKEIVYTSQPKEGHPRQIVRRGILLIFLNDFGMPTGRTWSEDQATLGNQTPRVPMVSVPGSHGRLWMSQYSIMFSSEFGALVPFDGHPWEQQITFWEPENGARYGPSLTWPFLEALRRQAPEGSNFPVPPVNNPALPPQVIDPVRLPVQPLLSPAPLTRPVVEETFQTQVPQYQDTPRQFPYPEVLEIQYSPNQHLPNQSPYQQSLLEQPDQPPVQQQVAEQAGMGKSFDLPPESTIGMQDSQHDQLSDHLGLDDQPGLIPDPTSLLQLELATGEQDGHYDQKDAESTSDGIWSSEQIQRFVQETLDCGLV